MIDANSVVAFLKWAAEVLTAAAVVFGLIWRVLNDMISKKVEAQISKLADKLTVANSQGMRDLREDIKQNHRDQLDHTNDRFDKLTERIDNLTVSGRR